MTDPFSLTEAHPHRCAQLCVGGCRPNPWTHETTPRPFTPTSPLPSRSPQRASSEHCLETSLLTSLPAVSLSYQFRCHHSVLSPPYIPPGVPVRLLALRLLPDALRGSFQNPVLGTLCSWPSGCGSHQLWLGRQVWSTPHPVRVRLSCARIPPSALGAGSVGQRVRRQHPSWPLVTMAWGP